MPVAADQGQLSKDTNFFDQKYTVGATWYPMTRLNLAGQDHYREADYDNQFHTEFATPPLPGSERNQRLIGQDWTTNDANIRITTRPKLPTALGTAFTGYPIRFHAIGDFREMGHFTDIPVSAAEQHNFE